MATKKQLDRSRPFATISSLSTDPDRSVYEQDGVMFNQNEEECGFAPGFKEKKEKAEKKAKKTAVAKEKLRKAKKVEDLLGSLDDPNADATKENAAAAAAEKLADG